MGRVQTRLEREQEFHDRIFGGDGRPAACKFYEVDRPGVDRYRELLLRFGSDRRVLEYGSGPGSAAFTLARAGAEVHGIDSSEVAIRQATERAEREGLAESCHFRQQDAERTSFPGAHFGLVCGPGIIHHLDVAAAFREVARVLEPDGRAVFFEPLGHNPAINAYLRRTPDLRTVDAHPLCVLGLELAGEHFGSVDVEYFNLLTLLPMPALGTRVFHPLLGTLHRADQALFHRFAASRKHAWIALFCLGAPRAGAPA
jgi:SAM-dependent methyltransferase